MPSKNIVHKYFKKEAKRLKILIKVDPIHFRGTELRIPSEGEIEARVLEFDAEILEGLISEGFTEVNGMEFNLYDSGLLGGN